jgi:predicted dehydrogenase
MKKLTRRNFLSQSALVAGAATAAWSAGSVFSARSYAAVAGANERVRIGIIGAGGMGRGNLATFLRNKEVECVMMCDVDEGRIDQAIAEVEKTGGKKPDRARDFRRVIDRRDIDVLVVSTPDHWHALPTVYGCQAGKDVFVEKPLATSIAEGRAMLEAARRHNRVVQMGTQWRSGAFWKEAVDFVQSGKLGKVGLVRAWAHHDWLGNIGNPPDGPVPAGVDYDFWLGPAAKRPFNPSRFHFNFRWFWDYAGGLMTDWGVHLINVILWAMGPEYPRSVSSVGGKFVLTDNSETPDTQIAVYEFPTYTMMWEHKVGTGVGLNGWPWGIAFTGSEGTLLLRDGEWQIIPEPKKNSLEAKTVKGSEDARAAHVRNFLDCVKSRQAPVENLEVGHHVSTVSHLGNIALRSGKRIDWDVAKERVTNDREANRLVSVQYRKPWKLPYLKSVG